MYSFASSPSPLLILNSISSAGLFPWSKPIFGLLYKVEVLNSHPENGREKNADGPWKLMSFGRSETGVFETSFDFRRKRFQNMAISQVTSNKQEQDDKMSSTEINDGKKRNKYIISFLQKPGNCSGL